MWVASFCSSVQILFVTFPHLWFAKNFEVFLGLFWFVGVVFVVQLVGFWFGLVLANHWSPVSVLRLPASVCSWYLYVVTSLSKPYFSVSQFYIVEVDFVIQKTPRQKSNQKWHRQRVIGISEETETFFVPLSQEMKAVLRVSNSLIFIPVTLNNYQYSQMSGAQMLCSRKGHQPFTVPRPPSGLRAGSNMDSSNVKGWLSKKQRVLPCAACDREVRQSLESRFYGAFIPQQNKTPQKLIKVGESASNFLLCHRLFSKSWQFFPHPVWSHKVSL